MVLATIPGFPRFGPKRELKWALEGYWSGKRSQDELQSTASAIRLANWTLQNLAGIDLIPVNDFSLYDHVLDTSTLVGAVPDRYGSVEGNVPLDTFFAMARGRAKTNPVTAMDMTKWFDTNYHYLVPELAPDQTFRLASDKPFAELAEAQSARINAKPVLVGPLTFLALAKSGDRPFDLLDALLPVYAGIISRLANAGATWIQLDEPILVTDRSPDTLAALAKSYTKLAASKGNAKLLVQVPFGHVTDAWDTLVNLPIDGLGLDFTRGPQSLDLIRTHRFPTDKTLVAGVVDGRNVWRNDLAASLATLTELADATSLDRLMVSASCSLLHTPYDVEAETEIDPAIRPWLAFATQKVAEVATLKRGLENGPESIAVELDTATTIRRQMAGAPIRNVTAVRDRVAHLTPDADRRPAPFAERARIQQDHLGLPALPTTTIGSFPQTPHLRATRKQFEDGEIDRAAYDAAIEQNIRDVVAEQEEIGIDVLVHGEPERNDMVQYFGEQLDGFAFTRHGWVQSYGSRLVRPPIIVGDVSRPHPMTVRWATYAQSLTNRPMKGMLTGPVTILNWSFVRDDQPRSATCKQIALAIRDEVADLEAAGITVIQIDEPALREGLPLRRSDWQEYLEWATESFRISAGVARPETQIHTHMCYSEFGDVIDAISALDADVLSIENARSDLEMLGIFQQFGYDKGIGPGVYDIHSPRVPPIEEMVDNLTATLTLLKREQIWVNPDCGLKTRKPDETHAALVNMVKAAQTLRSAVS